MYIEIIFIFRVVVKFAVIFIFEVILKFRDGVKHTQRRVSLKFATEDRKPLNPPKSS